MSRWFRFYAEAMRNPKVMRLSDKDFRLWVRLLAVASENDGAIPDIADLKMLLAMRLDHLKEGLNRLISGGLIDVLADGYEPRNWAKFQYKSDTSSERVAKHRAKRNVTVTPPETEAETDTEKKAPKGASGPRADCEAVAAEWNAMAKASGLPLATGLSPKRKAAIAARLSEHGSERMTEAITKIGASEFCRSGKWCGFDWMLNPNNFLKVIEGNYDGNQLPRNGKPMAVGGGARPEYRRDPAWEGLQRLHAELERERGETIQSH